MSPWYRASATRVCSWPFHWNGLVVREDVLRVPAVLQLHQSWQFGRSKRIDRILVTVGVADICLQVTVARGLHECIAQFDRDRVRIDPCRAGRTAGEGHFEHDLCVDVSPWVRRGIVRNGHDGLVGEELNLEDAALGLGILFVHLRVRGKRTDESRGRQILHTSGKPAVRVSFSADCWV